MVTAIILIDNDSNRLLAKYYHPSHQDPKAAPSSPPKNPFPTLKDQRAFEASIWEKTRRQQTDILVVDNLCVLYKHSLDLSFFLVAPLAENELMLHATLSAFYDAVAMLLRHQVEKRSILENLDLVVLALDETIDNGIVLETDPVAIASRVSRPKPDAAVNLSDIQLNEQSIMQAFTTVRDKIGQRILQG
ncbi:coatomer protein [Rhodotorula diobovata]|uniref:Coatomer subunit zeta n=1 Tax=Rhodotorula diobovata TaxID=5288 RepID=A0A5C5GA00_9BASI|nr:coatomer protein [Rhodotorula diobovata]